MSSSLIILIPSNEGIVIAAGDVYGDRVQPLNGRKLTVVKSASVVFGITGTSQILRRSADGAGLRRWLRKIAPRPTLGEVVERHLERHRPGVMDQEYVALLSKHFVQTVADRVRRGSSAPGVHGDDEVCCVVLAQYQRGARLAHIASFQLRVREDGVVEVDEGLFKTFRPQGEFALLKFGQTFYLSKNILGGPGRRYLDGGLLRRIEAVSRIAQLDVKDAAHIANALIVAASRAVEQMSGRARAGGRGGVHVLLVDGSDSVARELLRGTDYE